MKFVKLYEDAQLPQRQTEKAAGYDFHAYETITIPPCGIVVVPTGITFEGMATNQYLDMRIRSGTPIKRKVMLANGAGVVDSDYEGKDIGVILFNPSMSLPVTIDKGERIAQGLLLKYDVIDDEKKPTRKRGGGFGSTGAK